MMWRATPFTTQRLACCRVAPAKDNLRWIGGVNGHSISQSTTANHIEVRNLRRGFSHGTGLNSLDYGKRTTIGGRCGVRTGARFLVHLGLDDR
jgi:hypothetical protein